MPDLETCRNSSFYVRSLIHIENKKGMANKNTNGNQTFLTKIFLCRHVIKMCNIPWQYWGLITTFSMMTLFKKSRFQIFFFFEISQRDDSNNISN